MEVTSTKKLHEREEEEVERLVHPLPKDKPPRHDRRREQMDAERDPDLSKADKDLSKNRREIGGSEKSFRRLVQLAIRAQETTPYSSYPLVKAQVDASMLANDSDPQPQRTSMYHGIEPYPAGHEGFAPYVGWEQGAVRDLTAKDYDLLLASAREWLKQSVLSKAIDGMVPDARFRAALDLAIRSAGDGRYSSVVDANLYNMLLAKLAGESQTNPLLTVRESSTRTPEGNDMTAKFAQEEASKVLSRLDRIAQVIQDNHEKWGMNFDAARAVVNEIDKVADEVELHAYGPDSLFKRQVHVLRQAKVLTKDSDEGYMDTFNAPMAPIQTDADENQYMSLFKDDQSQAVEAGKSTTGRPLAP
jgi:hypothetical protein